MIGCSGCHSLLETVNLSSVAILRVLYVLYYIKSSIYVRNEYNHEQILLTFYVLLLETLFFKKRLSTFC